MYTILDEKTKCPFCKKKTFKQYANISKHPISALVGCCKSCNYILSPFEYESIQRRILADFSSDPFSKFIDKAGDVGNEPKDWMLKKEYITSSLKENKLYCYFESLFGREYASKAAAMYRMETHTMKDYRGATIFYQFNEKEECLAFKVIQYDAGGHRISAEKDPTREKDLLYQKPLAGIGNYCLFGRHILNIPSLTDSPICIVESEKTALMASIAYPQGIWMATGSSYYLTQEKITGLDCNRIILFPDPDLREHSDRNDELHDWFRIIENGETLWLKGVKLSYFMEKYDEKNNLSKGYDLGDYIADNYPNLAPFEEVIK
ncbi:MAG: hypothetical protein E7109_00270 [Bacteroidales bacterium]|nr:hypothetical protein [Bacteroidales bacterium]